MDMYLYHHLCIFLITYGLAFADYAQGAVDMVVDGVPRALAVFAPSGLIDEPQHDSVFVCTTSDCNVSLSVCQPTRPPGRLVSVMEGALAGLKRDEAYQSFAQGRGWSSLQTSGRACSGVPSPADLSCELSLFRGTAYFLHSPSTPLCRQRLVTH